MFYTYMQNNSGGSFVHDEIAGISHFVIVEADNPDHANERAEEIGLYFNGCDLGVDCDCCGDRWYAQYARGDNHDDGTELPTVYGDPVKDGLIPFTRYSIKWIKGAEGYIHYADGTVQSIDYPDE